MIPLKLELRNFMSYSSISLDLGDWKLVCLSGTNGSGKSSLLDSITWALWKKARTNHSDQLIRLGEREMAVNLLFQMDDNIYRVMRNVQKTDRGSQSSLELHVLNGTDFSCLTGKGVDETQKKINEIMKMDYQTFINSSFILQGRVDEFTTKTPVERKKILSEILGLDIYDKLRDEAKNQRDLTQNKIDLIDGEIGFLEENLKDKETLEENISLSEMEQAETQHRLGILNQEKNALQDDYRKMSLEIASLDVVSQHFNKAMNDLSSMEKEIKELKDKIENWNGLLANRSEIEKGHERLKELQDIESAMSGKWNTYINIDIQIQQLKREIELTAHQLQLVNQRLEEQLNQNTIQKKECEDIIGDKEKILWGNEKLKEARKVEQDYIELASVVQDLMKQKSILEEQLQKATQAINQEYANLKAQVEHKAKQAEVLEALIQEQKETEAKLAEFEKLEVENQWVVEKGILLNNTIDTATQKISACKEQTLLIADKIKQIEHTDSKCPLCETDLSTEDREKIVRHYHDEIMALEHELNNNQENIVNQEKERDQLRERYKVLSVTIKDKDKIQQKLGELNQNISNASKAREELKVNQQELAELEKKLNSDMVEPEIKSRLTDINKHLEAIDYNPAQMALLQSKVVDWKWAEIKLSQLEQAENKIIELNNTLESLTSDRNKIEEQLSTGMYSPEEKEKLKQLEEELQKVGYSIEEHQNIRNELAKHQEYAQKIQDLQQADVVKDQISRLTEQKTKLEEETNLDKDKLEKIPSLKEKVTSLERNLEDKKQQTDKLQNDEKETGNRLAILKSKLEQKKIEEDQKQQKLKQKDTHINERESFNDLVNIFGKNGIQAVIIENAIPEIEHDANKLLSKLTDGRMHVTISTQKESKTTDKISETLEIFISDELGTRNYELYSGGEMFRINFAIRLALSRLLSRRAGAKLELLFVDEGFGTQDAQGQGRLVEILNTISEDFAKIIIITHIQELKEFFPKRIEVYKEHNTSKVLILDN